jgi:hypothetical protein
MSTPNPDLASSPFHGPDTGFNCTLPARSRHWQLQKRERQTGWIMFMGDRDIFSQILHIFM